MLSSLHIFLLKRYIYISSHLYMLHVHLYHPHLIIQIMSGKWYQHEVCLKVVIPVVWQRFTDVWEECITSTCAQLMWLACSSQTSARFHQTIRRQTQEHGYFHSHCCWNLRSNMELTVVQFCSASPHSSILIGRMWCPDSGGLQLWSEVECAKLLLSSFQNYLHVTKYCPFSILHRSWK
jgi:hypothetical protein